MPEAIPDGYPGRVTHTREDDVRDAMHELPYGIYIVGSTANGRPSAMIADWVMQVSFTPRLIAVALENDSTTLAQLRANPAMTVNLLKQQNNGMTLAAGFVQPHRASKVRGRSEDAAAREYDKLDDVDFSTTDRGCPILDDALMWLECEVQDFVAAGDHTIAVARVLDGEVVSSGDPLTSTFTGWTYSG